MNEINVEMKAWILQVLKQRGFASPEALRILPEMIQTYIALCLLEAMGLYTLSIK